MDIDEQWAEVERCYQMLRGSEDRPVLASLRESWESLEPGYRYDGRPLFERGEALRRTASSPMALLFYCVDMGFYPPPEILLALGTCWDEYKSGQGTVELEAAFFGGSRQRAGNAAKRSAKRLRDMRITWRFAELIGSGISRAEAAERVALEIPDAPDADSILRMLRRFDGFAKRKEKPD